MPILGIFSFSNIGERENASMADSNILGIFSLPNIEKGEYFDALSDLFYMIYKFCKWYFSTSVFFFVIIKLTKSGPLFSFLFY